ncbi:hypothetical protein BR93DRAFT_419989 [Coniochaeta sp. PMI_546]|nr:hypothetical protein BR93DRAFT_419989 [Coniochaeta sp. PMI_546]
MTIKERWQRLLSRKSLSSGHSSSSSNSDTCDTPPTPYSTSGTSTPTSTIPISSAPPPLSISPSGISASLSKPSPTGNTGNKEKKSSRSSDRKDKNAQPPRRRVHPSERPLTEANLRQQEMLSQFKWEFGRSQGRRDSLGGWSVESGISPCCSRRGSLVPPPAA